MLFNSQEQETFEKEIEPLVTSLGFKLVEAMVIPGKKSFKIRVTLYSENGISVDDCALVSREIENNCGLESMFGENYSLEVSSPGINRKLKRLREYKIFIGKPVKIYLKKNVHDKSFFEGTIKKVSDNKIFIATKKNKELSFDIQNISKGKINESIQF